MANNNEYDFFDYGWVVDSDHPIKPKPGKGMLIDLAIGLGVAALGIGYTIISAFGHGAHAYEKSQLDILRDTGHLTPRIDGTVDEEQFNWHTNN